MSRSVYLAVRGTPKRIISGNVRILVGDLLNNGEAPALVRAIMACIPRDDSDVVWLSCVSRRAPICAIYAELAGDPVDVMWQADTNLRQTGDDYASVMSWLRMADGKPICYELW